MTQEGAKHGFLLGGRPEDLFKSAAGYYAAYRRPYPQPFVNAIVERCGLDGRGSLLDAGCGTGQVFQVFARWFDDVLAIDPDPEMVDYARRAASDHRLDRVEVRQTRIEALEAEAESLRMAIFGASFHWTDRARVGDRLYDLLEPGGHLAILSPSGIHNGTAPWEIAIQETLKRHLGPERRAGSGVFRQGERHEEALRRTRFEQIEIIDVPMREQWSTDQIVGYLFSTSYASKSVLDGRAEAFEEELRQALLRHSPDGRFEKPVDYTAILAKRRCPKR